VLPTLPWMWLFVTSPWHVLFLNLVGGAAWAAFNLANFQHLLEITDESERESYVAFFHTAIFLALFVAPFLGGLIIDHAGYRPAFFVSGAGRCISTAMFFMVVGVPSIREEARRRLAREPAAVIS
jgi:MFS family permease